MQIVIQTSLFLFIMLQYKFQHEKDNDIKYYKIYVRNFHASVLFFPILYYSRVLTNQKSIKCIMNMLFDTLLKNATKIRWLVNTLYKISILNVSFNL